MFEREKFSSSEPSLGIRILLILYGLYSVNL